MISTALLQEVDKMSFGILGRLVAYLLTAVLRHPDAEATASTRIRFLYVRRWSAATVSCGATSSGPRGPRRL